VFNFPNSIVGLKILYTAITLGAIKSEVPGIYLSATRQKKKHVACPKASHPLNVLQADGETTDPISADGKDQRHWKKRLLNSLGG
jgi:hypothetical protein